MPKLTQKFLDDTHTIRSRYETDVERARNDKMLSTLGQTQQIAKAYVTASTAMENHRNAFTADAGITADDRRQQVFGGKNLSGADAVSLRDAYSRAAQITTPREAQQMLAQAKQTGDDHLARAVAAHAQDHVGYFGGPDWSAVVDTFTADRPDARQALAEIAAAESNTAADNLQVHGQTYLTKPDELARISLYQTQVLAEGGDPWDLTDHRTTATDNGRDAMIEHFSGGGDQS